MTVKKSLRPKTKLHSGKSFGLCKTCGNRFKLKRKTKHRAAKLMSGVICPVCGAPKKNEVAKQ